MLGHARSESRAADLRWLPGVADFTAGDLGGARDTKSIADPVNALGRFDAVIHNASIGYCEPCKVNTPDSHTQVPAVSVLEP